MGNYSQCHVQAWWKTKDFIKSTQIELIKVTQQIEQKITLLTLGTTRDLNMPRTQEFKGKVTTGVVFSLNKMFYTTPSKQPPNIL